MQLIGKLTRLAKAHILGIAVALFVASCIIVPYRVSWKLEELSGDYAAGYYLLFDEPSAGKAMYRVRSELPLALDRLIPVPPTRGSTPKPEPFVFDRRIMAQRYQRSALIRKSHSISAQGSIKRDTSAGQTPASGSGYDPERARKKYESEETFDEGLARVSRSLDSEELLQVKHWTEEAIDSIFHEDSIRYERNARGRESEIGARKIANAVHPIVRLDFWRMIPQVGLTAFLCLLALLKTKKKVSSD